MSFKPIWDILLSRALITAAHSSWSFKRLGDIKVHRSVAEDSVRYLEALNWITECCVQVIFIPEDLHPTEQQSFLHNSTVYRMTIQVLGFDSLGSKTGRNAIRGVKNASKSETGIENNRKTDT